MRGVAEKEVCSIIGALVRELVRIRPAKEASLAGRRSLMLLVPSGRVRGAAADARLPGNEGVLSSRGPVTV